MRKRPSVCSGIFSVCPPPPHTHTSKNPWCLFNNPPHEAQTRRDEKSRLGALQSQRDIGKLQKEEEEEEENEINTWADFHLVSLVTGWYLAVLLHPVSWRRADLFFFPVKVVEDRWGTERLGGGGADRRVALQHPWRRSLPARWDPERRRSPSAIHI